jgi:hypothetical protein
MVCWFSAVSRFVDGVFVVLVFFIVVVVVCHVVFDAGSSSSPLFDRSSSQDRGSSRCAERMSRRSRACFTAKDW